MMEVQWFVARYERDLMRGESRNIGVILRSASGPMLYRFLDVADAAQFVRSTAAYSAWVDYWTSTIEKHGVKCVHWLPRRRVGESYYVVFSGSRIVQGSVNFDELFDRLCGPPNPDEELPEELLPGHWKK